MKYSILFYLFALCFVQCKKVEIDSEAVIYKISKDSHYSTPHRNIRPLIRVGNGHKIESVWVFNETALYKPDAANSQNKLTGIRYNSLKERYNIAMIAWNCRNDSLFISPYLHREGSTERVSQPNYSGEICCEVFVETGKEIYTAVQTVTDSVFYNLNGRVFAFWFPKDRSNLAFEVQPYFGGTPVAPHDIFITKY